MLWELDFSSEHLIEVPGLCRVIRKATRKSLLFLWHDQRGWVIQCPYRVFTHRTESCLPVSSQHMSNLPFLFSISVHKQWKTSAKQRQLQEEVRQPHLCDTILSEHCLGQCVAAERGQGWVPCGLLLFYTTHNITAGVVSGGRRGEHPWMCNVFASLYPSGRLSGSALPLPPQSSAAHCLPVGPRLDSGMRCWKAALVLEAAAGSREAEAGLRPAKSELSWAELKGAEWSCVEQPIVPGPVLEVAAQSWVMHLKQWRSVAGTILLSGVCLSLLSTVSAQGQRECSGERLPPCLFLGTAMGVGRATILALSQGHVELSREGECLL